MSRALVVVLLLCACGRSQGAVTLLGRLCDDSAQCGELSCVAVSPPDAGCGLLTGKSLCTRPCSATADCAAYDANPGCFQLCGAASYCLAQRLDGGNIGVLLGDGGM